MSPSKIALGFLFTAAALMAATPSFLLGVDYSEAILSGVIQMATDGTGAIYLLSTAPAVMKLSPDGATLVWRNQLPFAAKAMAVDPNGGVYIAPAGTANRNGVSVAKLGASGSGIAWTASAGPTPAGAPVLAADAAGRVYVSGGNFLVRIDANGTGIDYTATLPGQGTTGTSIAPDGAGGAFVAGFGGKGIFLTHIQPDGSSAFFSSVTGQEAPPSVALDPDGEEVVYGSGQMQRYDASGNLLLSATVSNWPGSWNYSSFAIDAQGDAYILGSSLSLYPVLNTLATCGADILSVLARDGTILQTTYIPGAADTPGAPMLALGANSDLLIVDGQGANFTASRTGPITPVERSVSPQFLLSLSQSANAVVQPLACAGNAASFATGPVAPGEIVTLFGSGLGPQQGIATQASLGTPFPKQAGNVAVTFDNVPAPLLWVQDRQINAIAPWFLSPGQPTRICVAVSGLGYVGLTNCLTASVAQTSPAVFMVDSNYAAALNQDGTVNSAQNPASGGSIVSIFATGLGAISPAQPDGALVGLPLPENVLAAGVQEFPLSPTNGMLVIMPLQVTYAGPAPYLVSGASQINFHAQAGLLEVTVAGAVSQPFSLYIAP